MTLKLLEKILHFKKESKNMIESDKKIAASYLIGIVKKKKLDNAFIRMIERINGGEEND